MKNRIVLGLLSILIAPSLVHAQAVTKDYRVITTAVPFMTISPDSKGAALGDAGVANTPDASSIYWNTAKLAYAPGKFGAIVSYAPWLRDIVNDMGLMTAQGYYKINSKQAIGFGLTYFDQGLIQFTTENAESAGDFHSREYNITLGVSQKLNSDFSTGLNIKFINSNLVGNFSVNNQAAKPGRTAAVDFGVYYNRNRPTDQNAEKPKKIDADFGLVIQNIGGKVNYGFNEYFIPANLKIGTKITHKPDDLNAFNFLIDFNKLLVPTPKADMSIPDVSVFNSIFSSFSDAEGGFRGEIREVTTSLGAEYSYADLIAIRTGYFHEAKGNGDRKYFTAGFGLSLKEIYKLDLAYLIPTKSGNPLANSWRISLNIAIPDNFKKSAISSDDSEN